MTQHGYDYDYFVIGAGSGGVRSARIAAGHGAKVGIAEGRFYGGTCVNIGCVPKKLFAYAADHGADMNDGGGFGWACNEKPHFDWQILKSNKDQEIERLNGVYKSLLKNAGVTIHDDYASFIDDHILQVGSETITANKILIATGGRPRLPDIPGSEHMIVSDDAFYLDQLPEHITIFGGGYIAVEFAHIFHGLGVKTTLAYRGDLFLRGFDVDIRKELADHMSKTGIDLQFNADIQSVEKSVDNPVDKALDNNKSSQEFTVHYKDGTSKTTNCIMSAIGRVPLTENLSLDNAGIELDKNNAIMVNEHYQTNIPHIYAVGDVTNRVQLTPVALAEGHYLADTIFGGITRAAPSYENIPTAVFSSPNISTIGLTEQEALDQGHKIRVYMSRFRPMKYRLSERDENTVIKLIEDRETGKIIGLHMIGLDVAEMLQGFAVAIIAGATKADFDRTVGIHPTSAEELVTMREASYERG